MFKPLSLYIGLRYTRAKKRSQFISFVALISMLGIALGVCVLITVLSVMNGFDEQIRNRIFSMAPQITITHPSNHLSHWETLTQELTKIPGINAASPYIEAYGLLSKDQAAEPAFVKGILPTDESRLSSLAKNMTEGSIDSLTPGSFHIILGQKLAWNLGVSLGDKVAIITPQASITPIGILPKFKRFTVTGIFQVGSGFGFDDHYAFIPLADAQVLYGFNHDISGLQLKIENLFEAPSFSLSLYNRLGPPYIISNWTDRFGGFYHAVQMEKTIMFFILLLLIAIAAFNLVASLVMVVHEKRSDIAILRTFGATQGTIMKVFMVQGTLIGCIGTLLGLALGIILALNATDLVNAIQQFFHVQLLTPNIYFVDYLPSKLEWADILKVSMASLAMSFIATIYPAWQASKTNPVEALRYE